MGLPDDGDVVWGMPRTEKEIQNAILLALGCRRDLRVWRANAGAALDTRTGRMVTFGLKGQADISGVMVGGVRLEIEVKSSRGKQRKEQRAFQRMIWGMGGCYVLARSVEDAESGIDHFMECKWGSDIPVAVEGWWV